MLFWTLVLLLEPMGRSQTQDYRKYCSDDVIKHQPMGLYHLLLNHCKKSALWKPKVWNQVLRSHCAEVMRSD